MGVEKYLANLHGLNVNDHPLVFHIIPDKWAARKKLRPLYYRNKEMRSSIFSAPTYLKRLLEKYNEMQIRMKKGRPRRKSAKLKLKYGAHFHFTV